MKTPQQAATAWEQSTATGTQAWVDGLNNSSKPIVSRAIAQRAVMQSNFAVATAAGGSWERNLSAIGDAGIKAAAVAKQASYGQGVSLGAPKYQSAITKILAYEQAGLAGLNALPSGTTAAAVQRVTYWVQYMAAGKGKLGA